MAALSVPVFLLLLSPEAVLGGWLRHTADLVEHVRGRNWSWWRSGARLIAEASVTPSVDEDVALLVDVSTRSVWKIGTEVVTTRTERDLSRVIIASGSG